MATYEDLLKAVQEFKDKANEYEPDSLERKMVFDPNIQKLEELIEQADKADESERSDSHSQAAFDWLIGIIKFVLENIGNDEIDDDSWLS